MSALIPPLRQPIQKDDWRLTVAPMMDWIDNVA
jgi:tRNA-dihydrouridine synthase A